MKFSVKIEGLAGLRGAIGALAADAALATVAEKQAEALRAMAEANFRSERLRPAPWPPLAQSTIKGFKGARKKAHLRELKAAAKAGRRARDPRPLIREGTLMRSLAVQNVSPAGAEVVSEQPYAIYHQWGSSKKPGRPPARPFVPVVGEYGGEVSATPEAEKRMVQAGEAALRAVAQAAGFKT